jgi:hypothetical protein
MQDSDPTPGAPSTSPTDWTGAVDILTRSTVAHAEEAISKHPEVSSWLRERALVAAMSIGQESDFRAGVDALTELVRNARAQYPGLDDAIRKASVGHARLGVHLDPLNPAHSHLSIEFTRGRHFDAVRVLPSDHPPLDDDIVLDAIESIEALLPATTPFPGHPHARSALVIHQDAWLRLVVEHRSKGTAIQKEYRIEPTGYQPATLPTASAAAAAVVQYFRYAADAQSPSTR